jgi:hypothetical protein
MYLISVSISRSGIWLNWFRNMKITGLPFQNIQRETWSLTVTEYNMRRSVILDFFFYRLHTTIVSFLYHFMIRVGDLDKNG